MSQFAKIFQLGEYQVLAYKDFDVNQDDIQTYQIVTLVGVDGGAQRIAYGYKEEERRDTKFEEFDERGAQLSLDAVLQMFE